MAHIPQILVVGSFVMDLITSTQQFPSEGQTVLGCDFQMAPGGKGANQAVQAARLGARVTMVGKVGDDLFGRRLIASSSEAGIDIGEVKKDGGVPSAVGNVIIERCGTAAANRIIVVPGANMAIRPEDVISYRLYCLIFKRRLQKIRHGIHNYGNILALPHLFFPGMDL